MVFIISDFSTTTPKPISVRGAGPWFLNNSSPEDDGGSGAAVSRVVERLGKYFYIKIFKFYPFPKFKFTHTKTKPIKTHLGRAFEALLLLSSFSGRPMGGGLGLVGVGGVDIFGVILGCWVSAAVWFIVLCINTTSVLIKWSGMTNGVFKIFKLLKQKL